MYDPNIEWFALLSEKVYEYRRAKHEKDYEKSDMLRKEIVEMGIIDLDINPHWHPCFESVESRSTRISLSTMHET